MKSVVYKLFTIFLAIAVFTFSKTTVFALNKTNEETTRECEESEGEKEAEVESKGKFEKQNYNGPQSDCSGLIQYNFDEHLVFNRVPGKNITSPLLPFTPLYLLYRNWKLDCRQ